MPQHAIEIDHRGRTIRGMVYRPETAKRVPAVLFLHGFTGSRAEAGFLFVRLARALNERGIAAVTFDFLHSGESDGSFEQMLVSGELADAVRMADWLAGQPFADRARLAVLGFSLGGLLAACAEARTSVFRAMVQVAPTTTQNLSRYAGEGPGPVVLGPHQLHPRFFEDLKSLDPVGDSVRHARRPTLLVQGTGDQAVTPAVSDEYVQAMRKAGVPLTVELVEGADHVFNKPPWRQRLIEVVGAWLESTLAHSPSGRGLG